MAHNPLLTPLLGAPQQGLIAPSAAVAAAPGASVSGDPSEAQRLEELLAALTQPQQPGPVDPQRLSTLQTLLSIVASGLSGRNVTGEFQEGFRTQAAQEEAQAFQRFGVEEGRFRGEQADLRARRQAAVEREERAGERVERRAERKEEREFREAEAVKDRDARTDLQDQMVELRRDLADISDDLNSKKGLTEAKALAIGFKRGITNPATGEQIEPPLVVSIQQGLQAGQTPQQILEAAMERFEDELAAIPMSADELNAAKQFFLRQYAREFSRAEQALSDLTLQQPEPPIRTQPAGVIDPAAQLQNIISAGPATSPLTTDPRLQEILRRALSGGAGI